jgi:hypothetical protein
MRKLLIALAIVAQPALADSYLMSFTPEGHAQLIMEHNLALPEKPLMRGPLFWILIDDNNPNVSEYIGAAETVVVMSDAKRAELQAQCEHIDDTCVDSILSEQGHD